MNTMTPQQKQEFRRRLRAWFQSHARDLPWRKTRDPYQIWISEIMLQQTQVATVIAYFQRFVAEFPDVASLAAAPEDRVLRLWEGLGYYRRARQAHAAAKVIVERFDGEFPKTIDDVLSLPGVGRYTAGAILSIAGDARHPILEANTVRLLSRLAAYRDDPLNGAGQKFLWNLAEELLPSTQCGLFNQAMMELGSLVCTPRDPGCDACPVRMLCGARAAGVVEQIPMAKKKTAYEAITEIAVVIRRRRHVLLRRCAAGERWAGLWDFPRIAAPGAWETTLEAEIESRVAELTRLRLQLGRRLATFKHGVTRFRITLHCYEADWQTGQPEGDDLQWIDPDLLESVPLSATGRKIARRLASP